jgi:hypothetical protein
MLLSMIGEEGEHPHRSAGTRKTLSLFEAIDEYAFPAIHDIDSIQADEKLQAGHGFFPFFIIAIVDEKALFYAVPVENRDRGGILFKDPEVVFGIDRQRADSAASRVFSYRLRISSGSPRSPKGSR